MRTKLVLRLLDAFENLLGWTEVSALAKGDGALWATEPVSIVIEQNGIPHTLSVHWADVHVEWRAPLRLESVSIGQVIPLTNVDREPLIRIGTPPARLAPVTVKAPVRAAVPIGGLGMRL